MRASICRRSFHRPGWSSATTDASSAAICKQGDAGIDHKADHRHIEDERTPVRQDYVDNKQLRAFR
jgi:hypothetical protein